MISRALAQNLAVIGMLARIAELEADLCGHSLYRELTSGRRWCLDCSEYYWPNEIATHKEIYE